ncbi:MAG TPA: SRPBCC family protein [Burkholderiales bacterium]|nr:SRPBCC family protein [Burkholderiales bacterium]
MPACESTVTVSAPRERVWHILSDVIAWPGWLPTVTKVEALDGQAVVPGARFVVHQPRLRPATWTVSEVAAPERFVWVARSPGLRMVADHVVSEDSPGRSTVVLQFSFEGLLGGVAGRLFRSVAADYLAQEAAALKREAESQG